jgi:uncharacterized protein (TIGR02466 family)
MSTIKHEWWSTPVWEVETGFDDQFNNKLLQEIANIQVSGSPYNFNIWNTKTQNISILRQKILTVVQESTKNIFNPYFKFNPQLTRGWVNRQKPHEYIPLHDHGNTVMAVVYYIYTPENCGDLLLVDPRNAPLWDRISEDKVDGIKYQRIKPKTGKLILFPGYVGHMVEQNKSNDTRISLATNIISW